MRPELQAKFLQHLNRKNKDGGFTLIELLVVIIIIGILAAIALPSFLNQANKAKQSEAKTYVGSLNKGQQAFFTEKGSFGTQIQDLGVGIKTQTVNYKYSSAGNGATGTAAMAYSGSSLTGVSGVIRNYGGMVSLIQEGSSSDATSVAILCETTAVGVNAIPPTDGQNCAANSTAVGK